ncbi:MAG: lamin tail domain-containing protein [Candidatus Woesearchaeota archaeon]
MGCKWVVLGLFLLSLSFVYAEVLISEVMYAPPAGSAHEWIEVYNDGNNSVNLSKWRFQENGGSHPLTNLVNGTSYLEKERFAVIANDAGLFQSDYPFFNGTLFDSSYFGLSDDGEELSLINESGVKVNIIFYNTSLGGKKYNTLCLFNSTWQECLATPGEKNKINVSIPINNTNSTNVTLPNIIITAADFPIEIYTRIPYNLFRITIKNKKPCTLNDDVVVEYNITGKDFFKKDYFTKRKIGCSSSFGEFISLSAGNYTICGSIISSTVNESNFSDNSVCFNITAIDISAVSCEVGLNINLDDTLIYKQGESISYAFAVSNDTFPFTKIEYWIEDIFGKVVKNKLDTTYPSAYKNLKHWTANIEEEDRVLYLKAQLYPSCKDQNLSNNYAQKMFIVTNEGTLQKMNNTNSTDNTTSVNASSILINKITPSELDWGEALRAEVEIHRGNTNKYAISAWVEIDGDQVSEVTKVNLYSKYTNYKLALPLLMDLRCEEDAQEAILVLEGLDQRAEQEVTITESSSDCDEEKTESTSSNSNEKGSVDTATTDSGNEDVSYELLDLPTGMSPGQILNFKVKFKGDEWDHFFQTYGYVYRGSRCYSCEAETKEREDYLQEFFLGFDEEKVVDFSLPLDGEMPPGEYKLKVRVHKDGQITAKSVDANITVGNGEEEKSITTTTSTLSKGGSSIGSSSLGVQRTILNQSQFLVYESSNEKAKKLIPYILVIVLGLLCIILMKEKWERK